MVTSAARVPDGVPTGGQFTATHRPESPLTLVRDGSSVPVFPDRAEFVREYPNSYQRLDRLNERWYAFFEHAASPEVDRLRAARSAVEETLAVHGRFLSLPPGEDDAEAYVNTALRSEAKLERALDHLGRLEEYEARSFGNRVAGLLYDLETEDRDDKAFARAVAAVRSSVAADEPDEAPEWLPEEPPTANTTW